MKISVCAALIALFGLSIPASLHAAAAPHITIALATLGVGWLMALAGIQKSALELRKRKRVCPSCGRTIRARSCACS